MMAGVAARLAGDHRLPFNYSAYAIHLEHDVARLQADVAAQGAPSSLSVEPLFASVSRLLTGAQGIEVEIQVRNQAGIQGCTAVGCTAVGCTAVGCTAVGCTVVGCTACGGVHSSAWSTRPLCTPHQPHELSSGTRPSHIPSPLPFLLHPSSHFPSYPSFYSPLPFSSHLVPAPSHTPRIPCTPPTTTANRSGQQQSMQVHVGEGLPHGGRIWGRRQLRPFTPIPHPPTPPPLPPPQQIAASSSSACRCTRGRGCPMEEGANCPSSKAFDAVNERLFLAERGFLDGHGIGPHYTWFKHLVGGRDESWCEVYGPEKDNDYATSPFPGIRDAIADVIKSSASKKENPEAEAGGAMKGGDNNEDGEEWSAVQHEIFRAARAIERAAKILEGQLL
ncbi:unnamed protein product [Closterium sp. NIES-53]